MYVIYVTIASFHAEMVPLLMFNGQIILLQDLDASTDPGLYMCQAINGAEQKPLRLYNPFLLRIWCKCLYPP